MYRLAGWVEFTFELTIPDSYAQDGSAKTLLEEMAASKSHALTCIGPQKVPTDEYITGYLLANPGLQEAEIPSQPESPVLFFKYSGPAAGVQAHLTWFDELCRKHFPYVHGNTIYGF